MKKIWKVLFISLGVYIGIQVSIFVIVYGIRTLDFLFNEYNDGVVFVDDVTIEYNNETYYLCEFYLERDIQENDKLIYEKPPHPFMTRYHQIYVDDDSRFIYETYWGLKDYYNTSNYPLERIYIREDIDITKESFYGPNKEDESYLLGKFLNASDSYFHINIRPNYESLREFYCGFDDIKFYLKTKEEIYFIINQIYLYENQYYMIQNNVSYIVPDEVLGMLNITKI